MEEDLEGYTQNQEELTLKSVGKKCDVSYSMMTLKVSYNVFKSMKCQSKTLTWDIASFLLLSFGSVGVIKAVDESLELSFSWIDWTNREP